MQEPSPTVAAGAPPTGVELFAPAAPLSPFSSGGCVVGRIVGLGPAGEPLVDWDGPGAPGVTPGRAAVAVDRAAVGREAVLLFDHGDPRRPVVVGLIQGPSPVEANPTPVAVESDGQRLLLTAQSEIVLRCGEASLVLTRDGKILIRGAYLSTRTAGVTRIKGGAIQLN